MLALAAACAAVYTLMDLWEVIAYTPHEWIGTLPKATTVKGAKTSERAKRIKSRLSGSELDIWAAAKYHDEIDAIGLGLKALGRLERRRVLPGAS